MDHPPEKKSAALLTREYIDRHPSIRDCLSKDIVNFSSLARLIMAELGLQNEEAILAAARRYAHELGRSDTEGAILSLLGESRLELKTRIGIITAKNDWHVLSHLEGPVWKTLTEKSTLQVIQGTNAITVITDDKHLDEVAAAVGKEYILKVRRDLAELCVKSPKRIEEVPGVVAYLSGMLAEHGINMLETVSCYTDTIFLVEKQDRMRAFEALSRRVEPMQT